MKEGSAYCVDIRLQEQEAVKHSLPLTSQWNMAHSCKLAVNIAFVARQCPACPCSDRRRRCKCGRRCKCRGRGQGQAPQFAQLLAGPPQWPLLHCQVRCLRTGQGLTGTIWAGRATVRDGCRSEVQASQGTRFRQWGCNLRQLLTRDSCLQGSIITEK